MSVPWAVWGDTVAQPIPTAPPRPNAADVVFPAVPDYTTEQTAELLDLLGGARIRCRCGCDRWTELGADPLVTLRAMREGWLADMQDRLDAQWRASDRVQLAALAEAEAAREAEAEARQERARAAARQQRADHMFAQLIGNGLTPAEAHAEVVKHLGDAA